MLRIVYLLVPKQSINYNVNKFYLPFYAFRKIGEDIKKLYVFENMVLGNILGPKWEEVTAVLRRPYNLYLLLCITVVVE